MARPAVLRGWGIFDFLSHKTTCEQSIKRFMKYDLARTWGLAMNIHEQYREALKRWDLSRDLGGGHVHQIGSPTC